MGKLAEIWEDIRRHNSALGEAGAALGSGMLAEIPIGYDVLGTLLRGKGTDEVSARAAALRQDLTYKPRTQEGEEALGAVGKGAQWVGKQVMRHPHARVLRRGWEGVTNASPALGAAIVAGANILPVGRAESAAARAGESAAARAGESAAVRAPAPRVDPVSRNLELPGIEPAPLAQRLTQAQQAVVEAQAGMHRSTPTSLVRYPDDASRGSQYHQITAEPINRDTVRLESTQDQERNVPSLDPVEVTPDTVSGYTHDTSRGLDLLPQIGQAQDDLARAAALRADRDALDRAHATEQREPILARIAALRAEPEGDLYQMHDRARAIVDAKRELPIVTRGGVYRFSPGEGSQRIENSGTGFAGTPNEFASNPGISPELRQGSQDFLDAFRAQGRARSDVLDFERLTAPPAYANPTWAQDLNRKPTQRSDARGSEAPRGQDWWERQLAPQPAKDETLEGFFKGGRENPALFEYGVAPPASVRGIESMADHYSQQSGKDISVDYSSSNSRSYEPEYIDVEQYHSRGDSPVYDRHGNPKELEHQPGETMYDENGDAIMEDVTDDAGNAVLDEQGNPVQRELLAQGGETPVRDERGDIMYWEAEGGEPMRDEHGNHMTEEEPNPDWEPVEDKITLSTDAGDELVYDPNDNSAYAMDASKQGGGALLYQTLFSDAAWRGEAIGSSSLTSANKLRILSNSLSGYARHGVPVRDVTGTQGGLRGEARGPDLWRTEASVAGSRVKAQGGRAGRVGFDGKSFTIDDVPATEKDIYAKLSELSPNFKDSDSKVGTKTLMRAALVRWLADASPQEAEALARGWGKHLGPIFSGTAAAAIGIPAMMGGDKPEGGL